MIDSLAAEAACTRLIFQFAAANDARRWEDAAALFVEDGLFARPTAPDQPVVGRTAILAAFQARPPRLTRHVVSNVIVTTESETEAHAHSLIQLYLEDENGQAKPPLIGEFHDRLVLVMAGWRFRERRGALIFRS
ncbi:nuclear transport factor 2 family protein [Brevundimonas sp.]|uniref:nuclear transport factor 2 family protein n=1 Tax=Brevundimonas sp. TaxID=1871086 RepID=UPI001A22104D|nr:nuclear transport factor 2 family protein [Brevundimonas sp.]MBJ7484477.1 nuclear transport factor 2 family protein [Brevundimonas sp.]